MIKIEDFNPTGKLQRHSRASLIRLKGRWLQAAGFKADTHVTVTAIAPGVLQLSTL